VLALLCALAACGGPGMGGATAPREAAIRTLAYAVTECHEDATSFSGRQSLQIRRGLSPVAEIPIVTLAYDDPRVPRFCSLFGAYGFGANSVYAFPLQRLAVSPDGSSVVFEVTFEFSILAALGVPNPLTPDQEGIFFVRADGTGLRRLGPASREPSQRLLGIPSPDYSFPFFSFSPDGRAVTFTDRPDGEDAPQVVVLDIASGARRPVTQLFDAPPDPSNPALPGILPPFFLDDQTIGFYSRATPTGSNPEGSTFRFSVKTDGTELTLLPAPVILPGSHVVPVFYITGPATNATLDTVSISGTPVNYDPNGLYNTITEIFVISPDQALQLTNFGRVDTGLGVVSTDGRRVFFAASANPLGTNPSESCEFFSIDPLGTDLRQLTQFGAELGADTHSANGCLIVPQQPGSGCYSPSGPIIDPEMGTLVFSSTCDPLGTNPNGEQLFAMHADGAGMRQLTATRGVVTAADGSVDVELPGPGAYSVFSHGLLY
jgi:hypothetical protein